MSNLAVPFSASNAPASLAANIVREGTVVIVPMFNEAMNAERCVRAICQVLTSELPKSRLLVIDDGSSDNTADILERLEHQGLPFSYHSHVINMGYGAALLTGAREAFAQGFEFGLFMDSDLTNDPNLIPVFVELADSGKFDLIKASRYVPGGGMKGVPKVHQFLTILGNRVAAWLFGIKVNDCTNGFRSVRLSMLQGLEFRERGFPAIMEELYYLKKAGARATEVPYILTARNKEQGKSKFQYGPSLFYKYMFYAIKAFFSGVSPKKQMISMEREK